MTENRGKAHRTEVAAGGAESGGGEGQGGLPSGGVCVGGTWGSKEERQGLFFSVEERFGVVLKSESAVVSKRPGGEGEAGRWSQ